MLSWQVLKLLLLFSSPSGRLLLYFSYAIISCMQRQDEVPVKQENLYVSYSNETNLRAANLTSHPSPAAKSTPSEPSDVASGCLSKSPGHYLKILDENGSELTHVISRSRAAFVLPVSSPELLRCYWSWGYATLLRVPAEWPLAGLRLSSLVLGPLLGLAMVCCLVKQKASKRHVNLSITPWAMAMLIRSGDMRRRKSNGGAPFSR